MRLLLGDRETGEGEAVGYKQTNSYIEMEFPLADNSVMVVYLLPTSHHSAYVGTCWGHLFDHLIIDMRSSTLKKIDSRWPLLARLVQSAISKDFEDCALLHLKDPDSSDRVFCLVKAVDGLDFSSMDGIFTDQTNQAVLDTMAKSHELLEELDRNDMEVWGLEGDRHLTLDEIRERLSQLDELEDYAKNTLKKIYSPEGPMEYVWWSATWLSGTRSAWKKGAAKAVEKIQEERAKLRLQETRLMTRQKSRE